MHDMWFPSPREKVTTIPVDETSGIHILYAALKDVGYDLRFEEEETDPNSLTVTTDPMTARKIEHIRDDINREDGDLRSSANALLEPWDGLIEDISLALEYPTSVSRVLSEAHRDTQGSLHSYNHLAELFVLAYDKGEFGNSESKSEYKKIPFHDKKASAIKARLRTVYEGLIEAGVKPITVEETRSLMARVVTDYLRPRPHLRPMSEPNPTEVPAQE